ncbi:uncharacterized protein EV420DRAFT_1484031 [Desarmillaria tabescens]|uniref:Uncharacterized protein n=1 Tax=Armillaria tabescens TaxID=1929756 RepID=A0AA39JPL4_ARMTA|nr:uncharacterized protein EV420DRAFT_1484031 [Desarmillaria tabescens]KAK0446601.1 hypothetical protein EV420DRAFT_1484031 [Desarmillaria tabescens]
MTDRWHFGLLTLSNFTPDFTRAHFRCILAALSKVPYLLVQKAISPPPAVRIHESMKQESDVQIDGSLPSLLTRSSYLPTYDSEEGLDGETELWILRAFSEASRLLATSQLNHALGGHIANIG